VNTEQEGRSGGTESTRLVLDLDERLSYEVEGDLQCHRAGEATRRLIFSLRAIQLPVYALVIGWLIGR
jgi:hypothetical protein